MVAGPLLSRTDPTKMLEGVGPELDALLSGSARKALLLGAAKSALPARLVCLECRLAEGDERVDLALCLAPRTPGLDAALEALGRRYATNSSWQRSVELLLCWATQSEATLAAVPFLYTAFDLGESRAELPVPCLSLSVDPAFFMRRLGLPAPRASRQWPLELLDACYTVLGLGRMTAERRRAVETCLGAVEDTEVRHLSLMLGRESAPLKFDVTLPAGELGGFLRTNGWQGDLDEVTEQLRFFAPSRDRVQINYVVPSHAVASRSLEVELCCTGMDEWSTDEREALLHRLVSRGLASPDKARALSELSRRPSGVDALGRGVARNWYVKVRVGDGRPSTAKAYIGLAERRLDGALGVAEPAGVLPSH